ncbi:MAG: DUF1749 domain-containing protein [Candidatus Aenigmarchaeota archaeon]|nr:DUF1749 domain-containing protein [Candidatus Aenigmarchaeota archaeon]
MKWDYRIKGELVRFRTDDGALLHGFLVSEGHDKIFIHFHGMGSNFYDDFRLPYLTEAIIKSGYTLLVVNNRGHDTVAEIPDTKYKWSRAGTAFEKFETSLNDVKGAVDFAGENGFSKIILSGHSTGCQKITYYQSKVQDKRLKGIVLLAPADDYNVARKEFGEKFEAILKEAKKLDKNDLMPSKMLNGSFFGAARLLSVAEPENIEASILNYDSEMKLFSKIRCPVLAIFGSKDKFLTKTSKEHLKILKERTASQNFGSVIIKNADHSFTKKEKELVEEIRRWLVTL